MLFRAKQLRKNAVKKIRNPLKRIMVKTGYILIGSPLLFLETYIFWFRSIMEYDAFKYMKECPNKKISPRVELHVADFDGLKKSD